MTQAVSTTAQPNDTKDSHQCGYRDFKLLCSSAEGGEACQQLVGGHGVSTTINLPVVA